MRSMLPDWWSPDIEQAPDGAYELAVLASRRFGLEFKDLLAGKATYRDADFHVAYKHNVGASAMLGPATHIAKALATAVLDGVEAGFLGLPRSSDDLASSIRTMFQSEMLDLESMAAYCWKIGIPVIPLAHLPVGVRRMDGAVMKVSGRPVIVVSRNSKSKAWISFILAHEIGHIFLDHIPLNGAIIDVQLAQETVQKTDESSDDQEQQANQFALTLFEGDKLSLEIAAWGSRLSASDLALRSIRLEKTLKVPAGHVALRYGFTYKRWTEAQNALRFIPSEKNPQDILISQLKSNLNFDKLAADSAELVIRLTGLD